MPFQYVSFQRPPPRHLSYAEKISIAPSITNDLRDEVFCPEGDAGVSLCVAWILLKKSRRRCSRDEAQECTAGYDSNENRTNQPSISESQSIDFVIIKREDNISWTGPQTAWKNVTISSPSRKEVQDAVKTMTGDDEDGQEITHSSFRVAMWVDEPMASSLGSDGKRPNKKSKHTPKIDLHHVLPLDPYAACQKTHQGETVHVSVLTPPIEVDDKPASKSSCKLTENSRLLGVPPFNARAPSRQPTYIEIMEQNGYELDKHIWDASIPMKSLLSSKRPIFPTDRSQQIIKDIEDILYNPKKDLITIELGSGTGSLSLYLYELLREHQKSADEITRNVEMIVTDLESSLEFTNRNVSLHIQDEHPSCQLHSIGLDWYSEDLPTSLEALISSHPSSSILILASDCSYNPDTYDAFTSLLSRLFKKYHKRVRCLVSKKHRHEDEIQLWEQLKQKQLKADLIDGIDFRREEDGYDITMEESLGNWGIYSLSQP
ncbi:unnamed protein product [Sympodiomycopsis kandeliae]